MKKQKSKGRKDVSTTEIPTAKGSGPTQHLKQEIAFTMSQAWVAKFKD